MINFIKNLFGTDNRTFGVPRSPKWSLVRKEFLKINKSCEVCSSKKKLEVHHCIPFHIRPDLELSFSNLVTLCDVHHLLFGHLMNWSSYNKDIHSDILLWSDKIKSRP